MPLTTKDALLERMVDATENLATNIPAKMGEYLPLEGGTMTGAISFDATGQIGYRSETHESTPRPCKQLMLSSTDINHWNDEGGAKMSLHTYDSTGTNTAENGSFGLVATDGTNSADLVGYPSGNLTWKGTSLTDGSLVIVRRYETSGGPSSGTYITAPTVSGYQFVCWVASASNGTVRTTYISDPDGSTARVWYEGNTFGSNSTIRCYALYIRKW